MNETKCVTAIPPCWLRGYKWYNAETGEYFDPLPSLSMSASTEGSGRQSGGCGSGGW